MFVTPFSARFARLLFVVVLGATALPGLALDRDRTVRRATTIACSKTSFDVGRFAEQGAVPSSLLTADFTNDGIADFVIQEIDGVRVYIGDGRGGFLAAAETPTEPYMAPLAAADFNGDGNIDLFLAGPNGFALLLGDGAGGFLPGPTPPVLAPLTIVHAAAADFNRDGNEDIVVVWGSAEFQAATILLGDGAGNFNAMTAANAGFLVTDVAVGDFDNDGFPDLVVANSGGVTTLRGDGSGGFKAPLSFAVPGGGTALTVADFNEDGVLDLAVGTGGSSSVLILIGAGGGSFSAVPNTIVSSPQLLVAGDYDGDGHVDLAIVSFSELSLLRGDGTGHFEGAPRKFAIRGPVNRVVAGDFDRDGKPDLLVAGPDLVDVLLGNGALAFRAAPIYPADSVPSAVVVADVNGDGRMDLVTANGDTNSISVLLADEAGGYGKAFVYPVSSGATSLVVADFNGDGNPDIAVAGFGSPSVSVLLGIGAGHFGSPSILAAGTNPGGIAVGDFNGDGRVDLVVANSGSTTISVFLGDGSGGFGPKIDLPAGGSPTSVIVGDFNGDSVADLAVSMASGPLMSVMLGNGDGTFGSPIAGPGGTVGAASLAAGDFNGDGHLDLAVAEGMGAVSVLAGRGDGHFDNIGRYVVGDLPGGLRVADFNADGFLDLVITEIEFGYFVVLAGDGTGSFSLDFTFGTGNDPASVSVADIDGDGRPDFVVTASGGVAIFRNTSFTLLPVTVPDGSLHVPYTAMFASLGGSPPFTYGAGGVLPPGLAIDPATGVLSGAPTTTGAFPFSITATDGSGCTTTKIFTVNIRNPAQISVSSSATGPPFNLSLTAVVRGDPGQPIPTGTVIFSIDGIDQEPVALVNGVATLNVPDLAGAHEIRATYSGDGTFSGGSSSLLNQPSAGPSVPTLGMGGLLTLAIALAGAAMFRLRS